MEYTKSSFVASIIKLNINELVVLAALGNDNLTVDFVVDMAKCAIRNGSNSSLLGFVAGCHGFSTVAELAGFFWEDPELWMPIENKLVGGVGCTKNF